VPLRCRCGQRLQRARDAPRAARRCVTAAAAARAARCGNGASAAAAEDGADIAADAAAPARDAQGATRVGRAAASCAAVCVREGAFWHAASDCRLVFAPRRRRLIVLRHAAAEPRGAPDIDAARALSARGKRDARAVARCAPGVPPPGRVPLRRLTLHRRGLRQLAERGQWLPDLIDHQRYVCAERALL
jgi:hypothetical protein